MSASGAVPPDFTTPIGQFRLHANDTKYVDLGSGVGTYQLFSDAEITGYILQHSESLLRAVGYGYLALAANAALQAKDVKDYDLAVDLTKRSAELRSTARFYFDRAEVEADILGTDSTFGIDAPAHHDHWRNRLEPTQWDVLGWGQF